MLPQVVIPVLIIILILAVMVWGVIYGHRYIEYTGPRGRTIVRCSQGHLFTTTWIPFASFKAIRLGLVRIQHCPVGNHWTFVVPVKASDLSDEQRRQAESYQDTLIP